MYTMYTLLAYQGLAKNDRIKQSPKRSQLKCIRTQLLQIKFADRVVAQYSNVTAVSFFVKYSNSIELYEVI